MLEITLKLFLFVCHFLYRNGLMSGISLFWCISSLFNQYRRDGAGERDSDGTNEFTKERRKKRKKYRQKIILNPCVFHPLHSLVFHSPVLFQLSLNYVESVLQFGVALCVYVHVSFICFHILYFDSYQTV